MLQVARLAPTLLHEASDRVAAYLSGQFNPDGGVRDRHGRSDLYYTVFGLGGLAALQAEPPLAPVRAWLEGFGDGEDLDLVHLASLARCWASLPAGAADDGRRRGMLGRLGSFRAEDGGFAPQPGAAEGGVYHAFLAHGAYQDLGAPTPEPERLLACVRRHRTGDGAYAGGPDLPAGTTPVTAAALTLMRNLGAPAPEDALAWLRAQAAPGGGFVAVPGAPMPDLLSTATALHALDGAGIEGLREPCLDYVDTLWTGRGFCGTWADDEPDAEYTYYALLALGHLSL
jgi:prenyltransferase beta subunit